MSIITALATGLTVFSTAVIAHDDNEPGLPVCLEANYMMADAMNPDFSSSTGPAGGPGRVIEMNIITGERGITVDNPFNPDNLGTPVCDNGGVSCFISPGGGPGPFGGNQGPWKPTGVLSGGENGHAFLTSAAQHALTEFHRDGTAIRTAPTFPTSPSPGGGGFGFVPRLLGTQIMPNGNLLQTVCDANFFNAPNSDAPGPGEFDPARDVVDADGVPGADGTPDFLQGQAQLGVGNASNLYFPPVYSTPERAANSRILVLDQNSLEVIDEYSAPDDPRWTCPAGIAFSSEGMIVTGFHSAAAFIIDWKAGLQGTSTGVGSNDPGSFKLNRRSNKAQLIRVVDLLNEDMDGDGYQDAPDAAMDDPHRRDSLRANSLDESGNLYGTFRARSNPCTRGQYPGMPGGCNPGTFRQHVFVAKAGGNVKTGTIAMDPGVNVIAGIRINRMSAIACANIGGNSGVTNPITGAGEACDVETLYVATSAGNAGCVDQSGPAPNPCFVKGGTVYEYLIDEAHLDGGSLAGDGSRNCTGAAIPLGGSQNAGCAQPVAQFKVMNNGVEELVDPRMLMPIHEAFIQ